jgi:CO/xanthine dehydrogenase Mo-binding subunit
MKDEQTAQIEIEAERYELHAPPAFHFEVDRRDFCKILGGGIFIALAVGRASGQESGGGRRGGQQSAPKEIGAWLHIGEDGAVTVFTGKVEVGQDIRTSLSQVVAEELRVPLKSVRMTMGDTDLTPYDMGTFGSMTTRVMTPQLRKAAAAARGVLIDLAAEHFKTDPAKLTVENGNVTASETRKTVSFGQLAKDQRITKTIPDDIALTPPAQWQVAGKPALKVSAESIVTGAHRYSSDIKRPGMLYGKIVRPSAFNATLISADTQEAEKLPGVKVVHDSDFIGLTAPTAHAARKAAAKVKAEWKTTPQPSSKDLFDYLKKSNGTGSERGSNYSTGSVAQALTDAAKKLSKTYTVAYIAHIPLEPRAAVAEWTDGKLTVWTGTQRPFGVRSELAQAFHIPEDKVRVIMPDTGSGYGGKHTGEAAIEAARLAKAAEAPVKLVWTREEEFTWAYCRPAGVIEINSGMTAEGQLTAWEFHNYNSGGAGIRTPYEVANQKIEFHATHSPLRQGSYRGLAATANHFARESHMDELAAMLRIDPLQFRLRNLKDQRLQAVFVAAAERFGWGRKPAAGRGVGIAGGVEKGGYVATCAEVSVDPSTGQVKVIRVATAFECGPVINPEGLKNQIEGSLVMGIGGALFEALEFENGRISNPRFSEYRVPRFSDTPQIDTVLIDRKDLPTAGAGETPIVGIAPAIGNAIFNATGIRPRSMPMAPAGIKQQAETSRST